MTADEWDTSDDRSDDWRAMLGRRWGIDGSRKLRLWAVAVCRHILDHHARTPISPGVYADIFTSLAGPVSQELDAVEQFADGFLTRRKMQTTRPATGGPHNVLHAPTWHTRMRVFDLDYTFRNFVGEFGVPTGTQMADLLRDIFRPFTFAESWRSESAVALARTAYETRNFSLLPILADALEEAGCDHPDVLSHCRQPDAVHVRGCWVVDGVLGKA